MIKADSIRKITEEIVLKNLLSKLESIGFKYLKSKRHFKRTAGNFDQIIFFETSFSPLEINENTGDLFLKFHIHAEIKSPKFDKWIMKELKSSYSFCHYVDNILCIELVDSNTLNIDDFLTTTNNRKFKNPTTFSSIGLDNEKRISLLEVGEKLEEIINSFDNLNTAKSLFNSQTDVLQDYLRLLVFESETELAENLYLEVYDQIKNKVDLTNTDKKEETKKSIKHLEEWASEIEIFFNLKLENPFKRELYKLENKDEKIKLSPNLGFKEYFRFDTSLLYIKSFDINDIGEVLMVDDEKKLIKINSNGSVKTIGTLKFDDCFSNELSSLKVKWISNSNTFSCENFLLSENEELIELVLDFDKTKFKTNEIPKYIKEVSFDSSKKEYHLLYLLNYKHSYHSVYDESGQLISTYSIDKNILKLNISRQEYIVQSEKNSVDIMDFEGNIKGNFKFGHGNNHIELSSDGKLMLFHSYSTKSQLYNLDNKKKQTLWGHPTFLKNYKEKFYNDINHNFGLITSKFTPDGKHIIGGADHGKYVIWDTNKFERKELIPNKSSQKIFNWFTTTISDDKSTENYFIPYTVEHEKQNLFINRGYDLSNISFIEKGKYIVMQVSDCLLVWNNDFENIGYVYGIGRVTFSANNFLAYKKKNELVVYRKVNEFNNDFESSVFKEYEKENSNIINISMGIEDL